MQNIRAAIIGFGLSGRVFHAQVLRSLPGFEIAAVVSSRVSEVRDSIPSARVVSSEAEVFHDPTIDLVIITTPNELHAPLAIRALEAGKHVVVEKPFSVTAAEGQAVVDCAKRMNRVLSVYHNRRWDNGFLTLREALESGQLGTVYSYEARFERFRPVVKVERWREQEKGGSGVLYDLGSHLIDQAVCLFGAPRGVYCDLAMQRAGAVVDDYFTVLLDYGALRVVLRSGCIVGVPGPVLVAHGDKGTFRKQELDPQEEALKAGRTPESSDSWGLDGDNATFFAVSADGTRTQQSIRTIPGSYHRFYAELHAAITSGASAPVPPEDAVTVIRIIEASLKSSRERRWVEIGDEG
jgi:scyllo-inositol 2-dehydrogenase (NADP+)